jgi:hypothetical protein
MWWWNAYGPTPWMFFGPVMMLVFMAIFMTGMLFLMRAMHRRVGRTAMCDVGVWPSRQGSSREMETPDTKPSAFEEYRAQTLRRLDQEQTEFQEFIARLRAAKDKAEFEQFMVDRRMRPSSPQA